jgi:hypothetical protein
MNGKKGDIGTLAYAYQKTAVYHTLSELCEIARKANSSAFAEPANQVSQGIIAAAKKEKKDEVPNGLIHLTGRCLALQGAVNAAMLTLLQEWLATQSVSVRRDTLLVSVLLEHSTIGFPR